MADQNLDPNVWDFDTSMGVPSQPQAPSGPSSQPGVSFPPAPGALSPEQERLALWEAVVALGRQATQTTHHFETSQNQIKEAFDAVADRIANLQINVQAPAAPVQVAAAPSNVSMHAGTELQVPRGSVRFKEPSSFGGASKDVEDFLDEILNAIHLQRASIITSYDKALFLSTYLKSGSPKSWFYSIKISSEYLLDDFDGLLRNFRKHFGDPDLAATAQRKLDKLRQAASCAAYAARSRELHAYLDLSDTTKINMFYKGLKAELKDTLAPLQKPTDFDEYVTFCTTIDNRLHFRNLEKKEETKTRSSSSSFPYSQASPSSSTPSNDVVPMEIDSIKRGPITAEEKERRRAGGLCYYCGQGVHRADDCPNMSQKVKDARAKARAAKYPKA